MFTQMFNTISVYWLCFFWHIDTRFLQVIALFNSLSDEQQLMFLRYFWTNELPKEEWYEIHTNMMQILVHYNCVPNTLASNEFLIRLINIAHSYSDFEGKNIAEAQIANIGFKITTFVLEQKETNVYGIRNFLNTGRVMESLDNCIYRDRQYLKYFGASLLLAAGLCVGLSVANGLVLNVKL